MEGKGCIQNFGTINVVAQFEGSNFVAVLCDSQQALCFDVNITWPTQTPVSISSLLSSNSRVLRRQKNFLSQWPYQRQWYRTAVAVRRPDCFLQRILVNNNPHHTWGGTEEVVREMDKVASWSVALIGPISTSEFGIRSCGWSMVIDS